LLVGDLVPYAQVASTLLAGVGLFFTARQVFRARSIAILQALQEFFKASREREEALKTAADEASHRHAFVEFLNFLELYSASSNKQLLSGVARELVTDKLIDDIVVLMQLPAWHPEVERSRTSEVTYKHIVEFISKNRKTIDARYSVARARRQ
jgi:hypothetical protein